MLTRILIGACFLMMSVTACSSGYTENEVAATVNVDKKFHFLEQVNLIKQDNSKSGADYENAILNVDYAATSADELIDLMETINQDVADRYESSILRLDSLPVPDDLEYFEFVNTQKSAWRTAELAYKGCVASWRIARLDLKIGLSAADDCLSAIEDSKSYLTDAHSDYENLANAFNRSKYIKR